MCLQLIGRLTITGSLDGSDPSFSNPMEYGNTIGTPAPIRVFEMIEYVTTSPTQFLRFARNAGACRLDAVYYNFCESNRCL